MRSQIQRRDSPEVVSPYLEPNPWIVSPILDQSQGSFRCMRTTSDTSEFPGEEVYFAEFSRAHVITGRVKKAPSGRIAVFIQHRVLQRILLYHGFLREPCSAATKTRRYRTSLIFSLKPSFSSTLCGHSLRLLGSLEVFYRNRLSKIPSAAGRTFSVLRTPRIRALSHVSTISEPNPLEKTLPFSLSGLVLSRHIERHLVQRNRSLR